MKKTTIGILVLLLLLVIGGVIFITTSKKDTPPAEQPVVIQNIDAVEVIPSPQSSTGTVSKTSGATTQTNTPVRTTNTTVVTQPRTSISAEERRACITWQIAHGYIADGICYGKGYDQEYQSTHPSTQTVTQTTVVDLCSNIQGNQSTVPAGMTATGNICTSSQAQTNTQSATPPIVQADPDKTITNPSSQILLSGSISGNTTGLTWEWSKISGEDNVSLVSAGFPRATINYNGITTSGTHNYTFRLKATNSQGGTAYDDMNVSIILTPLAPVVETKYPNWYGPNSASNKWNGQCINKRAETTSWFEFGASATSLTYRTPEAVYPATFSGCYSLQTINMNDINELREAGHFVIYFRLVAKNSVGTSYGDTLSYNFHN